MPAAQASARNGVFQSDAAAQATGEAGKAPNAFVADAGENGEERPVSGFVDKGA